MWQKPIKKTIYTLNVEGYAPEITALTYPLLERYAEKIGAEFHVIRERKFPEWPVVYEKLQIYRLAQEAENDWSIYVDSDALIHPEAIDFTEFIPRDSVAHNGVDMAAVRWKYDRFFRRDGRAVGSCNWLTFASDWCIELWEPLSDLTPEEAIANIQPTVDEQNTVITAEHLVDDYALSRNIAKYGLKTVTLIDLQKKIGLPDANFFFHQYTLTVADKVAAIQAVIERWKINGFITK